MSTSRPSLSRIPLMVAAGLVALSVAGCGSTIASLPLIGQPPEAQNRSTVQPEYPTVAFPDSGTRPMTAAERATVETDLQNARDRSADQRRKQITTPQR